MRRYLTSTRSRLTALAVVLLAIAVIIAGGALQIAFTLTETGESDSALASQAGLIAAALGTGPDGQPTLGPSGAGGETQTGVAVHAALVSPQGAVIRPAAPLVSDSDLEQMAARVRSLGQPTWVDVAGTNGALRRAYAEPLGRPASSASVLVVSRSLRELQAADERDLLMLILFSGLVVLGGGMLAYWLAGRILQPVSRIAELARTLSERDLHRRVDTPMPRDELGDLVETFNEMLDRLEDSFESLRRFTADASHELRAPLALMQTEIEVALGRARMEPRDYRRSLISLAAEVRHLTRIVDQLLILARADAGALHPVAEAMDVADFLHEAVARWLVRARERNLRLAVDAPDSGVIIADPDLIRRVVDNLLDNAIRHAPAGGRVSLRAVETGTGWEFQVDDNGPGIPADLRDHLFRPFVRGDSARSRSEGGAGLGLALSAAIATASGGSLSLINRDGPGACFSLVLPEKFDGSSGGAGFRPPPARAASSRIV